ncbi:MAG: ribosome recycling factor [Planctomycetes bacterium]|nr:ribosome recycling factor [Planctomycetota bacterium]
MPYDDIYLEVEDKMDKAFQVCAEELKGVRTGRASPALVDHIRVEYYGSLTPLKQIAAISTPDPTLIQIKAFDPSALKEIEKAILKSDIGITPQNDGKIIRLPIPALSEERRKQYAKMAKEITEKALVAIRNVRRDANKLADTEEKEAKLTEDEKFRLKEEIQKALDEHEKKIADLLDKKTKEIMQV